MSILSQHLSHFTSQDPEVEVNVLDADMLLQRLDVWATLTFEEFWDGYGMAGGVVYQDCEKYPFPPLIEQMQQRGIGVYAVQEETLGLLQPGKPLVPHLLDFEDHFSLAALTSGTVPAEHALLNFLTFLDLYTVLAENQDENYVETQRIPKPNTHQVIDICLTDYLDLLDWKLLKKIISFGQIDAGVLLLPLWQGEEASLTLRLKAWGKLVDPYKPLPAGLFRDLLKLAKLGLTQLNVGVFYDYGFEAIDSEVWTVPTSDLDYTHQMRDLAAQLRKFMSNKDTVAAGIKYPHVMVINPPVVDSGLLLGADLPADLFWIDAPTYAIWNGQLHETPFRLGE